MREPADWVTEWMAIGADGATILTLMGIVFAYMAYRGLRDQLREMSAQSEALHQSVEHAADAAASARRDATLAERGLELQQETMQAQLRAYLTVTMPAHLKIDEAVIQSIMTTMTICNTGQTPALNIAHREALHVDDAKSTFIPEGNWLTELGDNSLAVAPGSESNIRLALHDDMLDHHALELLDKSAFLYGVVDYEDVFGKPHQTKYSFRLVPIPDHETIGVGLVRLDLTPKGNTMT